MFDLSAYRGNTEAITKALAALGAKLLKLRADKDTEGETACLAKIKALEEIS